MNLKTCPRWTKPYRKRVHTIWYHLHEVLEQAKLTYDGKKHNSGLPLKEEWAGAGGTFCDDGIVFFVLIGVWVAHMHESTKMKQMYT